MSRMSDRVLICEIREIRGQELFHSIPKIYDDWRPLVFPAFAA